MTVTRVNREELLGKLQSLQPGLATRELAEQSGCFIFQNGNISTFNEEICCRISKGLDKEATAAVAAKPLTTLLEKLTEEELQIEVTESEMLLRGAGGREAGIRIEAEILIDMTEVEQPETWNELPTDFDEAVNIVASCAGTDESRFATVCVHFASKWLEAFDNKQLTRYKIKTGLEENFLVRRDSAKKVVALGMTHLSQTAGWLHFKNKTGLIVSCRRYLDEYPDLTSFLKVEGEPLTLPGGLAEEIAKAQIFSSENVDHDKILVELRPGKMRIKGQGITGWFRVPKKLKYDGPAFSFLVSPTMLLEICKKTSNCLIVPEQEKVGGRLRVDGEKWRYVAALSKVAKPQVKEETEPTEEEAATTEKD